MFNFFLTTERWFVCYDLNSPKVRYFSFSTFPAQKHDKHIIKYLYIYYISSLYIVSIKLFIYKDHAILINSIVKNLQLFLLLILVFYGIIWAHKQYVKLTYCLVNNLLLILSFIVLMSSRNIINFFKSIIN